MKYLVIPHLRAAHINLVQNSAIVTPHSVASMALFLHALGRQTGFFPERFAVVHHDAYLDADSFPEAAPKEGNSSRKNFFSWQRRAAQLINQKDISSKSKTAISLQPVVTGNVEFSLVLEYAEGHPSTQQVEEFLETARFQGGQILDFGSVRSFEQGKEVLRRIRTGRWVVDRRDLLERAGDPLAALLDKVADRFEAIGPEPTKEENTAEAASDPTTKPASGPGVENAKAGPADPAAEPAETAKDIEDEGEDPDEKQTQQPRRFVYWSAATVGYALLSEPKLRQDARNSDEGPVPSAFAESLVGLVGLYSVHDPLISFIPFWESHWPQKDLFVVQGVSSPQGVF